MADVRSQIPALLQWHWIPNYGCEENIQNIFTAVDCPFSNGQNERTNQTLVNAIRCKIFENKARPCLNAVAYAAPFNIERYTDFSGPLMESLGPIAISHASWKTVQRINIAEIVDAPQLLQQIFEKLQKNCNGACSYAYQIQFTAIHLNDTTRVIQGLRSTLEHYADRSKRSLIPIIGRVANLLFGTLDDLIEERIRRWVETSANDTRKLAALLANQTEIVDRRLETITNDILTLKKDVSTIPGLDERNYDELISELQAQIALVRVDAETLLEAILFVRTGIIHPRLLPTTLIKNTATLMRAIKSNNIQRINMGTSPANSNNRRKISQQPLISQTHATAEK
ncbi:unnamed protein product, partial [Trichogramma brassicae]